MTASAGQQAMNMMRRSDIVLALGVIAILVILILPMPRFLLDMSLAISMTLSVIILMTSLFIRRPLEFTSFPTILLISTILRLALNLASTRLILAGGHTGPEAAGRVIAAFGHFVMGGNFIIGIVVFSILVLVNFIVITKGSSRIAEVAARFSLDAMPGKQMAIDADLSSGLINEDSARLRRRELEEESTFFGAMDGAAKFVRGDAVAGLLITFINIIGGIIIGTAQQNLSLAEAAQNYTLLTVGDGLVSQIPALIVSTAAGLLVSKAGITGSTDAALFGQMSRYPTALGLSGTLLIVMGLLPGLPLLPFLALGGTLAYTANQIPKIRARAEASEKAAATAEAAAKPTADAPISQALAMDHVRVEIGYGLLSLASGDIGQRLTDQIKALRRQMASDMGFILPSVRIQDNLQLPATSYVIRIKEIEAARGNLQPGLLLCMDGQGATVSIPGEQVREPTFGLPATWIAPASKEEAQFKGYTVVDPSTVLVTHLTEIIRDNMPDLLSYAETQKLLDEIAPGYGKLVSDIIPSQITVGGLQRILQNLLAERVSIRDLPTILEGVAEACAITRSISAITEHVRARLARQLCEAGTSTGGVLPLLTLSPTWEQAFAESLVGEGENRQLAMPPTQLQQFITSVRQSFESQAKAGESPVLLTSPSIRPFVRSIVERFRPQTVVMSQNEIHPKARIKTMGQI
ncbi:MAG TPA: flagellar biosynthesis protein FlhA [Rhodospirillaceae bacterium]|nr:MAG: flagellar biosynthesis protein FlhA [Alphaproteobacteria bacterium GWF2_58_20]HAU29106.1 flagellar biosynthesis protein FlhA [Rhodospirillaceae bacterium]